MCSFNQEIQVPPAEMGPFWTAWCLQTLLLSWTRVHCSVPKGEELVGIKFFLEP